jgi:ferredoxin
MREPTGRTSVSRGKVAACAIDAPGCRGCGACEEACPFSVPRVVVRRGAPSTAEIDAGACRGCGVCVAACPTGAIRHPGVVRALPEPRGLLAIACARSGLFVPGKDRVPAGAVALELPCAGGAGPGMVLGALARGFDGVLIMGRQQETCRLNGAEDRVRGLAPRLEELARRLGLGPGRVRFVDPEKGREGPVRAIEAYRAELAPTALGEARRADAPTDAADDALAAMAWIASRTGAAVDAQAFALLIGEWIAPHALNAAPTRELLLAIDAGRRLEIDARIAAAAAAGKREIAARDADDFVQLAIALRRGTWRAAHVAPVLP